MNDFHTVLVVAATPELSRRLEGILGGAAWQPTFVKTFADGKHYLDTQKRPDLLVSEIKLGQYNGLHLALRSLALGIPAIVIGDAAFGHEAQQLGAIWVSPQDASGDRLTAAMARLVDLSHAPSGVLAGYGVAVGPDRATMTRVDSGPNS
jgi:DNA-binding NtrC family response regulator